MYSPNELLEMLSLDDLQGGSRELADAVGIEAFKNIVRWSSGGSIYIPQLGHIVVPVRNRLIMEAFTGSNTKELARTWGLTDRQIYYIVEVNNE